MADAIRAVLEDPPFELSIEARAWLARLLERRCRAHHGYADAEICPGDNADLPCRASILEPLVECTHQCPGPPLCPGSMGRLLSCEHARVYEERNCGRWLAEPLSCHVPGCPDCEPQRQAKHAVHYAAVVDLEDPRDIVLAVFTARNPRAGDLARGLRVHRRQLSKLRRTPLFTGRDRCVARTEDGGPFHPCVHFDHRWICAYAGRCARARLSRGRARRARRRCRILERRRRPCDHPSCRPNCPSYRHRGVAGGVWATECPPSTRTAGTWNLHTNAILRLEARDDHHFGWLAPWAEVSWYWRRATCPDHRRCPGRPKCQGGAWDVHLEGYDRQSGIGEYIKYVTKPAEILEYAGAAGLVEFLLARRRLKFLSAFGSFFGRRFAIDPDDQAAADAETVEVWISDFSKRRFPKICPFCQREGDWDGFARLVPRVDLRLVNGFLCSSAPP